MKKKLSYRDKLLELANIYDVREIKEYVNSIPYMFKNNSTCAACALLSIFLKFKMIHT